MESILVTGGAGYIGSHVCKILHKAGYLPVTIDNLSQGYRSAVRWGPLVEMNIDNKEKVKQVIAYYRPTAVIHLASSINVRDSLENPFFYYQNNLLATLKLLEAVCETDLRHFVFSSSAAVYGLPFSLPIDEEHARQPIQPYGKSKFMVEEILSDLQHTYGLHSASLRYFNAAGADPDQEIGEMHNPETHLIPVALASALGRRPPLQINGEDFPTFDGTAIRDYVHVTDLACAHLQALQWIQQRSTNLTVNLGTGQGYSVRQIINCIQKVTKMDVPLVIGPRRPEDPPALIANPHRATTLLGWSPRYSNLETIIETAHAWHIH